MKLHIVAVGHKMPDWIAEGFEEYTKRMPPELRIELREVKPEQRSSGRSAESVMAAERTRIEAALPKNAAAIGPRCSLPRRCLAGSRTGATWRS
jgi:23S rRNA (pseudouridine1915-N3)-methyltransferase